MTREEVDSVLDYRTTRKRRMYLIKWRHLDELTWEPEESIPKSAAEKVFALHKLKGEFAKKRVFEHLRKEPVKSLKVTRSRSPERRPASDYGASSSDESDRGAVKGPESNGAHPTSHLVIPKGRTGGLVMDLDNIKLEAIDRLLHVSDSRKIQPVLAGVAAELNSLFAELSSADTIANKICQLMWVSAISIFDEEDATKTELLELLVRLARQLFLKTATAEHTFLDFLKREYNTPTANAQILTGDGFSLILSLTELLGRAKASAAPTEMSVDLPSAKPSALPSPVASSVGAAGEFGEAEWRRLIYKVYELRNPEKLGDLPEILRKYPHGLPTLFETVCRKYQLDPRTLANRLFPTLYFELAADRQSRARKELLSIFASFDSARLHEVDSLLAMHAGRELALIEAERKKYIHEIPITGDAPESEFSPLVRQALAVGNFEKLFDVPRLLTKYKGREHYLYLAICEKYALPVDEAAFRAAESAAQAASQDRKDSRVREVIEDVYSRFNPAKLPDVPRLVEKYRGSERELLEQVCEKYGVPAREKMMMICSIDECADDAAVHQRLQQLLRHFKLPTSLWQVLLMEISTWAVSQAVSADHLRLLLPPKISSACESRAEVVIRGRLNPEGSEKDFTETLRERITPLLAGVHVTMTEQEPEYLVWDCFLTSENLRGSTLLKMTGAAEAVSEAVRLVCEFVTSLSETRDELESANLTCSAQMDDGSEFIFIGKGIACTFRPSADAPSPARARLSVWTGLTDEALGKVLKAARGMSRWFRQVVTIVNLNKKQVAVIGESQHRTAFKNACTEVDEMTGTEPDVAGLKIPKFLLEGTPQLLSPQIADFSDDEGAYFESGDDLDSEPENPSELIRPIRLSRTSMRELFTRGLVCLNCDSGNHKHTECTLKRKVCWNCHSIHSGTVCSRRCRFCKQKHAYAILDCVKRASKRHNDWRKSKLCADQRTTSALLDELHMRLQANEEAGREIHDVTGLMRKLRELGTTADLLSAVGDGVAENAQVDDSAREAAREFLAEDVPQPPTVSPPPLPDPHYRWMEIFYLDDLLGNALVGRDILKLLQTSRSTQLKDLEDELDCMIEFRGGAFSEIAGEPDSEDVQLIEERDLRLRAVIKCNSHRQAAIARTALADLMAQLELSMADPTWQQRPPLTEAFSFLDKVNLPTEQSDRYGCSTVDVELKDKESETGALRHWLHRQGIEVEVDDELSVVKLPPTLEILAKLEAQTAEEDSFRHDDPRTVAVGADLYFAFVSMLSNWVNPQPCAATGYWFEAFELEPLGLLGLMGDQESDRVFLEPGQRVKLSARGAVDLFSLLRQGEMIPRDLTDEEGLKLLLTFTGIVRAAASDFKLLLYLRHPWILSGASISEIDELVSPLPESRVARLLRDCGRLGTMKEPVEFLVPGRSWAEDPEAEGLPGDALLRRLADERVPEGELPYLGYIIDWQPPKFLERSANYSSAPALLPEAPTPSVSEVVLSADDASPVNRVAQKVDDLLQLNITTLRDKLKSQSLPQTGNKRDLAERLVQASAAPSVVKLHRCRFDLPKELMVWSELQNNITGSRDAHLTHITAQCPSVSVTCQGTASAVLVGEARLHVSISSTDEAEYRKARGLVEDLLKAVVEVGAEVCFPDNDQLRSQLIRDIRIVILAGEKEEPKPAASFSSLLGALAAARAAKK